MVTSTPPRRHLPSDAFSYLRDELWLARGLGPHLERVVDETGWQAWTLADPSIDDTRLAQFKVGGLSHSMGATETVCPRVARAMVDYNDAIWVVPEPLGGPDDGFLARTAVDYVVGGQAVYYVERSRDLDQMVKVWRQGASAAGQLGVVTVYGDQLTDEDEDALRALAEAARLVVITAYDGEGAVFFTRKSDEAFDHLG